MIPTGRGQFHANTVSDEDEWDQVIEMINAPVWSDEGVGSNIEQLVG